MAISPTEEKKGMDQNICAIPFQFRAFFVKLKNHPLFDTSFTFVYNVKRIK